MSRQESSPELVLDFWFGALDADGRAAPETQKRWFMKNAEFDREIRERFGAEHAAVAAGGREDWLTTPRGRLAYVIVLDQFSRNLFRDKPGMFAHDAQALAAAIAGIERGDDLALAFAERSFLYMPLMHSERESDQNRCVDLFTRWRDSVAPDLRTRVEGSLGFAVRHRDIVARFGRFPHRNAILGRASTPDEEKFLREPGSGF